MLQLLKESVSSKHAERLEQIVIALIAIEIGAFKWIMAQALIFHYYFSTWDHHDSRRLNGGTPGYPVNGRRSETTQCPR